jgi:hypothetical protein
VQRTRLRDDVGNAEVHPRIVGLESTLDIHVAQLGDPRAESIIIVRMNTCSGTIGPSAALFSST